MILLNAYGNQGVEYVVFNVICPHMLIGSDITRRFGFVGVVMALLKEVGHGGGRR